MKLKACDRLDRRPLTGCWFRALSLKHWATRLSSTHSATTRSRFSPATPAAPAYRIVYFGETHQVAIHEVGALLGDPASPIANPRGSWALLSFDVILHSIIDLTTSGQQRLIGTSHAELTGNWSNAADPAPTQRLGESLHALPGLEGFLDPSSRVNASCLVVFPHKLGPSSTICFNNELSGKPEFLT